MHTFTVLLLHQYFFIVFTLYFIAHLSKPLSITVKLSFLSYEIIHITTTTSLSLRYYLASCMVHLGIVQVKFKVTGRKRGTSNR